MVLSSSPTIASDIAAPTALAVESSVASPTADPDMAAPADGSTFAVDPGQSVGMAAPDSAPSADAGLPVLVIHGFGGPDYGVIRPESVASSGDGHQIIDNMVWSSWTATEAHADATREVQSCSPSCAEGTITPVPMTFDLSDPVDGHFTKVVEVINGESTTITDAGFTPGDLGFVGALLGALGQSLAATPAPTAGNLPTETAGGPATIVNVFPVMMIYPDGASAYAVVRPDNLAGPADGAKLEDIVWDHWTTTEAVGTGTFTPATTSNFPPGSSVTFQVTMTLTNPVNGAFSTFHYASVTGVQKFSPDTAQDIHYKGATPDSARVPIPCTC